MWDLLWPAECAGCGQAGAGRLCPDCRPSGVHRVRLPIVGVRGAWTWAGYDTGVGRAVRAAKARPDRALLALLAATYAARLGPCLADAGFTCVVPAPSTAWSRFRRGFAGAAVIADAVARGAGLPVRHAIERRGGSKQATLGRDARRRNLTGKIRGEVVVGGRVLLVDDVITTGATVEACARELLGSGASEVWVAALCVTRATGERRDNGPPR